MASIVKRGKSYSVVYSTYINGSHKQKWETYHSEAEALRRKEVVESWQRVRQKKMTGKIETVEQLVWAYVRLYGKSRWSLSMYDSSLGLINNYIIPYFGSIRLHELSPRMVAWMYGDLLGQQRYNGKFHRHPGERLSPHTLKSVHKLLHSVFEQAVLWEYVPSNPFQRAILPKTKSAPRPFLAPEQIHILLDNCKDLQLKLAIELAFACTLREGELLALTWDDINWDERTLRVNKTLTRASCAAITALEQRDILYIFSSVRKSASTALVLKAPKTAASNRIVYMPTTVMGTLLLWKGSCGTPPEGSPNLIFTSDRGLPLQNSFLLERFHALLASCGLPKVAFHSLRHSSITYKLILTHGNIKAVQGDSGHAQADMITEVYGHILDQRRRAGAELFEVDFFQGQFPVN